MRIKNFATFGLFANGMMIETGSIQRLENEAVRQIMSGQAEALTLSVFGFEGDDIIEETRVLSYRKVNDSIIITNMLLKEGNEE